MKHFATFFKDNPVWTKITFFSMVLLMVHISDAIISFWAPLQIESSVHNPAVMGLVIGFQSVVGLAADLLFPKMLRSTKVRRLIYLAIAFAALTSVFLATASLQPWLILFIVSMFAWGVYYELMAFGTYQFVDNAVPPQTRSAAWGILDIFKNLAYFIGPMLAGWLLLRGFLPTEAFVLGLLIVAVVLLAMAKTAHDTTWNIQLPEFNVTRELSYWWTLTEYLWPIIIMTLIAGFVDATFWTTGVIWTAKLAAGNPVGNWFLPAYQLPPLFLGLVVAKLGIFTGKKKAAEITLCFSGIVLILLGFVNSVLGIVGMVLLSSVALSFAYPLMEGVYSDIVARMGREKKHLIGLTGSTMNISYIIWPPVAGYLTLRFGEGYTFAITGGLMALIAFILLFITPKKLRLPQSEIQTWDAKERSPS